MFIVECVGLWHVLCVPAVVPGLVATEQKNGRAARVEGIKHSVRSALVLEAQFPHVAMAGAFDTGRVRKRKRRAVFYKQVHDAADADLLVVCQIREPFGKAVGPLDIPNHG